MQGFISIVFNVKILRLRKEIEMADLETKDNQQKDKEVEFTYFKPIKRLLLIFFLGFSIYLFFSTMILIFLTKSAPEVKVPELVGKRFVDVSNGLSRKGFRTELKFVDVYDLEDGIILKQYPESGTVSSEGSKLTLTVTRSKFYIDVPNLVGSPLPIAVNKLRNLHYQDKTVSLGTGVISYIPSDKTAANIVMDQYPPAGNKVGPEGKVNILVSSGNIEADNKMPNVQGQSLELCFDLLMAKKLTVMQEVLKTDDINKSGIIESQSIVPDTPIKEGDIVTLKVNYYNLTEHPYAAYEYIDYTIPSDEEKGFYEVVIDDNKSRRVRFSAEAGPGQRISLVFYRVGNARIYINRNKKNIRVMSSKANDF